MVLLSMLDHSCISAATPTVPGVVTLIVNAIQFLGSTTQSISQSNILSIFLLSMLLGSGMNSLIVYTAQCYINCISRKKLNTSLFAKAYLPHPPLSPLCLLGITWLCHWINGNYLDYVQLLLRACQLMEIKRYKGLH